MPINAIRQEDVFNTDRFNPGESNGVNIVCATNTLGINRPSPSVANQIGKRFHNDFLNLGAAQLGHLHYRAGQLSEGVSARFYAIVTNEVKPGTRPGDNDHDWQFAPLSIAEGLNNLSVDGIIRPTPQQIHEIKRTGLIDLNEITDSPGYDPIRVNSKIDQAWKAMEEIRARINPIVRIVLIGTGASGTLNHADTAGILESMHASDLNLVLYLKQAQVAHVAEVINLYPKLRHQVPVVNEVDRLQLLAA
ncbi:MAG: hypothetical protein HHAS10_10130 [Candidatus Altimarinota bacterium]